MKSEIRTTLPADKTVWIIDDDETELLLATETLQDAGFRVRTFADASSVLAELDAGGPDVFVVDAIMPGLNGFEFCRRLRELPAQERVPVLMATMLEDVSSINEAYTAGATEFTSKPVNWNIEIHRLRNLVDRAELALQLERTERDVRQAQKMEAIGAMAGGMAHDFNNLLTVILSTAEIIRYNAEDENRDPAEANAIIKAAHRGAQLTQQLLMFARRDRRTQRESIDLNEQIDQASKMLRRLLPKNVVLKRDLDADLAVISADRGQLDQVLINLVVNASHAMPEGGEVTFSTRCVELGPEAGVGYSDFKPGRYVRLCVIDSGHGMSPKTLDRIFEPFFTTKESGQGTGLGLAVVFGIVRDHGGIISCASRVGQGTTFTVHLPAGEFAAEEAAVSEDESLPLVGGSETILVVDDEESILCSFKLMLSQLGYQVHCSDNSSGAIDLFRTHRPDAVLMDLDMPTTGWEVMEQIREIDPEAVILVITGHRRDNLPEEVRAHGAYGLVRKPFSVSELTETLREMLENPAVAAKAG